MFVIYKFYSVYVDGMGLKENLLANRLLISCQTNMVQVVMFLAMIISNLWY